MHKYHCHTVLVSITVSVVMDNPKNNNSFIATYKIKVVYFVEQNGIEQLNKLNDSLSMNHTFDTSEDKKRH